MDDKIVHFPLRAQRYILPDQKQIPPRPWLMSQLLLRGHITEIIAASSVGKSFFVLALLIHAVAGLDFGPFKLRGGQPLKIGLLTAEEDRDELDRRMAAAAMEFGIEKKHLANIHYFSGVFCLATADKHGTLHTTPSYEALKSTILLEGLDLLVVDPLVEIWRGSENDNSQVAAALGLIRDLCRTAHMAALVCHHVRKGQMTPGDLDAARGASSGGALVRLAYTLMAMSAQDANALGLDEQEAKGKLRLDRAKANYLPSSLTFTNWFRFVNVTLDNADVATGQPGDEVGVLRPWKAPALFDGVSITMINDCLDVIDKGMTDGERYTDSKRGNQNKRFVGPAIEEHLGKTEAQAKDILKIWMDSGLLYLKEYETKSRKPGNGLCVDDEKRPENHDEVS